MKVIAPGRYEIQLAEPIEIKVSFGLKSELYKIIARGQLDVYRLNKQVGMPEESRVSIRALAEELDRLKAADPQDAEAIRIAESVLDAEYAQALTTMERLQREALAETSLERITLTEDTICNGLACLLSKRDKYGAVTDAVTAEQIKWDPDYEDYAQELMDLLVAVVDYLTSSLKKISKMTQMIQDTGKEAEKNPQEPQESSQSSET